MRIKYDGYWVGKVPLVLVLCNFVFQLVFGMKLLCLELNVLSPLSNRFFPNVSPYLRVQILFSPLKLPIFAVTR